MKDSVKAAYLFRRISAAISPHAPFKTGFIHVYTTRQLCTLF